MLNQSGSGATLSEFSDLSYDGAFNRTGVTASITGESAYSGATSYTYADNTSHNAWPELTGESSYRLGGYSQSEAYDSAGKWQKCPEHLAPDDPMPFFPEYPVIPPVFPFIFWYFPPGTGPGTIGGGPPMRA